MKPGSYLRTLQDMIGQRIGRLRRGVAEINIHASALMINLTLIFMWVFSVVLIILALDQISVTTKAAAPSMVTSATDRVLSLFVAGEVPKAQDKARADLSGIIISATGAIITAVFAMIAWLVSKAESNSRARRSVIALTPVYNKDGLDDIELMVKEYRGASSVVVFGGDFSWMREAHKTQREIAEIRSLVTQLAKEKKIKLISYKDEASVKNSIGQAMLAELSGLMQYNSRLDGLRASFVNNPFGRVLIYKVHADHDDMHICRITDRTPDGKELLDQFRILVGTVT